MNSAPVTVTVTPTVRVGPGEPLLLIAGPCQIESLDHARAMAEALRGIAAKYPVNLVYKSSFDKANRTSGGSARGAGIDAGLKILDQIRREFSVPVLTDIHLPEQAAATAQAVDVLQIPAFLCRQTDLLVAAGKTGKTLNIKKGQFLHPADMAHVADKAAGTGNRNIMLCERGSCFGYRDLVVDMRSFPIMRATGYPVVFDATHSVQQMGGSGGSSGGMREFIHPLVRGAIAVGIDALFIECHQDPDRAPSDGASMLKLDDLDRVLKSAVTLRESLKTCA